MAHQPIQAPSPPPVSCLSGGSWPLAETARREDHQRTLPDPGCNEERYRLTGRAALGLAAGLLSVGLGILWHTPVIFTAIALLVAILAVIAPGRRMIAFRSDHAGITLGAIPDKLTFRRGQAVFVPGQTPSRSSSTRPACEGRARTPRSNASESSAVT